MSFTLREPTLSDASDIADLHVRTWREAYSHLLPEDFFSDEHIQSRHRMWSHILSNPNEDWSIRIAENHEEMIGFAHVDPQLRSGRRNVPS